MISRIYIATLSLTFTLGCAQELPEDDGSSSTSSTDSAQVVDDVSEIPACPTTDDGALYFARSTASFYFCAEGTLTELSSSGGAQGPTGAVGPAGIAGPGYTLQDLSSLTGAQITSIATGNTGTNQFASGTGAVNLTDPTNAVDAADAQLTDYAATTTFATATTGLATGFGCVRLDLEPILAGASVGRGYVYAKIGIRASAGSANATTRWETSATGTASTYTIGASQLLPMTTVERTYYLSSEFFARYVSLCVQGNGTRNHILNIYQFYVAM